LFEEERFDALHIDHLNLAQYLPGKKNCPWILEEHNLESQGKWTIARREKLPANLIFLWEAVRLWLKERVLLKKFDHLLAISAEDKRLIEKKGVSPGKISILPTPMKMKKLYQWGQKNILFIGLLSWWPNKDAINWFLEKIYPQLKKKIVGLKFLLVGEGLKPSLKERVKRDASMTLTGYVKNIKPYLKRAGVFVLPFRMGSGLRIKMLIAMAAGIPVVGTRKGFEGLIGKEKIKGLLIADNEKELVNYLVKVLKDKELAQVVSQKQLVLIRKYYSKKRQEKVLKDVYE